MFTRKHKITLFAGVITSLLFLFLAVLAASIRSSWFGQAQTTTIVNLFSQENSYIFASPTQAFADGRSMIRVTVFLLNSQGLGVSGQKVTLRSSQPLAISQIEPVTDNFGRAIFDATSTIPGHYSVGAEIAGLVLQQSVSISFR